MSIIKSINLVKSSLFSRVTNHMVNSAKIFHINEDIKVRNILICRPNQRLGNLLLITPLIQEIESIFPNAKIDLIVKGGLANPLFKNYTSINQIYQLPKKPFMNPIVYIKNYNRVTKTKYDLVINATCNSSSGRIIVQRSNGKYKIMGNPCPSYWGNNPDFNHIAKKPILAIRELLDKYTNKIIPKLNLKLNETELKNGHQTLKKIFNNNKKTICFFTFATGNKIYSKTWWEELYSAMIKKFNNCNIIEILPLENVSQIDFKAVSFYGNNIRELGALISASDLFIGADSGIMHLASSVRVPTLGLYDVTDEDVYRPYNHLSKPINTNKLNTNDIIIEMDKIIKHK